MSTCPAGHETEATDYCDVCGVAMDEDRDAGRPTTPRRSARSTRRPTAARTAAARTARPSNPVDALFCEACGYDFTTGSMPRTAAAARRHVRATTTTPSADADANPSATLALRLGGRDLDRPRLVRRPEERRPAALARGADRRTAQAHVDPGRPRLAQPQHHPDIDLSSDNGISRRHAQLTTDGKRWWVEDLGSSNGTYVGGSVGPLPATPIPAGQKKEVASDARVYLGAWTRIVIRKAADGEV